jgi:hypothetical protein
MIWPIASTCANLDLSVLRLVARPYDAMFVDGYSALLDTLAHHSFAVDPREAVVEFVEILVRFSGEDVVRQQLLFERTIPATKPRPKRAKAPKDCWWSAATG